MREWEVRWCLGCGHDTHPRERKGPRPAELACSQCGSRNMATIELRPVALDRLLDDLEAQRVRVGELERPRR